MSREQRFSDEDCLYILTRLETVSMGVVAAEYGVSRNSIAGLKNRIKSDLAKAGTCECIKPENKDGGMPERWWER